MKEKQGMILLYEWIPLLKAIDPNSPAVKIWEELEKCDRTGECDGIDSDNALVLAVFGQMRDKTLEHRQSYVSKCEKNRTNVQKRWSKDTNVYDGKKRNANHTDYDYDCDIDCDKEIYSRVVRYLNDAAKTNYRSSSKKTRDLIKARLNEGYKYEDFVVVIDKKVNEWSRDPKMSKFLRPETLFGSKFEGYLNQPITKPGSKNFTERNYSQTDYDTIEMAMT